MMKHPEILAPAGSFDSLIAAVQCGANAVYLGGKGSMPAAMPATLMPRNSAGRWNTATCAG